MLRRYKLALVERARHVAAFEMFCEFQKDNIGDWTASVEKFENGDADIDPQDNLYRHAVTGMPYF